MLATLSHAPASPSNMRWITTPISGGPMSLLARILSDYLPVSTLEAMAGDRTAKWRGMTIEDVARPGPSRTSSITLTTASQIQFSLPRTIHDILSGWLLAVPKSKTTHSRKGMRSANKGLKNRDNISLCPGCSTPKLSHHLCPRCFSQISRRWKEEARAESAQSEGARGRSESFA